MIKYHYQGNLQKSLFGTQFQKKQSIMTRKIGQQVARLGSQNLSLPLHTRSRGAELEGEQGYNSQSLPQ